MRKVAESAPILVHTFLKAWTSAEPIPWQPKRQNRKTHVTCPLRTITMMGTGFQGRLSARIGQPPKDCGTTTCGTFTPPYVPLRDFPKELHRSHLDEETNSSIHITISTVGKYATKRLMHLNQQKYAEKLGRHINLQLRLFTSQTVHTQTLTQSTDKNGEGGKCVDDAMLEMPAESGEIMRAMLGKVSTKQNHYDTELYELSQSTWRHQTQTITPWQLQLSRDEDDDEE